MSTIGSKYNKTLDDFIERTQENYISCLEVDIPDDRNLVTVRRGITAAIKRRGLPITIETDLQLNADIQPMKGSSTQLFMLYIG